MEWTRKWFWVRYLRCNVEGIAAETEWEGVGWSFISSSWVIFFFGNLNCYRRCENLRLSLSWQTLTRWSEEYDDGVWGNHSVFLFKQRLNCQLQTPHHSMGFFTNSWAVSLINSGITHCIPPSYNYTHWQNYKNNPIDYDAFQIHNTSNLMLKKFQIKHSETSVLSKL